MSKIKIIGIDPGAKRCGYAVIEFDIESLNNTDGFSQEKLTNPKYIDSGIFGLSRNDEIKETYTAYKMRLIPNAVEVFQDKFDEHQPDLVVFEFLPVTGAGASAGQRVLSFAVSTTGQVLCELNGVPWTEITAVTVKKQMTDSGVATKAQVKRAVLEVFPELKSNKYLADETDALAIPIAWTKRKNTES